MNRSAGGRRCRGLPKPLLSACLLLAAMPTHGDEEASNGAYVVVSSGGQFYARCIPAESYGLKGRTEIYEVGQKDRLLHTYDWYSTQTFLEGWHGGSVYAVEMGPWHRGNRATKDELALAIYKDGALLKKYSTLDIAGTPENVSSSISHYVVFRKLEGFRADLGGFSYFRTEATDGRELVFNLENGQQLTPKELEAQKMLSKARGIIGNLKIRWLEQNHAAYAKNRGILLTKEMLMSVSGGKFPILPAGYEYVPGQVWGPPEFKKIRAR